MGHGGTVAAQPIDEQALADVWRDIFIALPHVSGWREQRRARRTKRPRAGSRFGLTTHTEHMIDLRGGFDWFWKEKFKGSTDRSSKGRAGRVVIESDSSGRLVSVF